jgi:very-short-patch-repair endonuclease
LTDQRSSLVHLSVPVHRQVTSMKGAVIHRSTRLPEAIHPSLLPPRTRLEETVIDLADRATNFDAALSVACSAGQRRLTTAAKLVATISQRSKLRWRSELIKALGEVGTGVHSILEYRYVQRVERSHGLPEAARQARLDANGRSRYLDNLYRDYALCVELDGLQAHPDEQRWQDLRRINSIIADGTTVLRYGWIDVNQHACETTVQVGAVLGRLGWRGSLRPCSPTCPVGRT